MSEKKPTKIERMHQHVVDSCTDAGKPADVCDGQADRVVERYRSKQIQERWQRNQEEHMVDLPKK